MLISLLLMCNIDELAEEQQLYVINLWCCRVSHPRGRDS